MQAVHDVVETRDLVYRQVDGVALHLDLYRPARSPADGAVVYLHGGAWLMGDRTEFSERFTALAGAGVAVASIDYRTVDHGAYPRQRDDIVAALGWLEEHRHEYGIAAPGTVLMGASAGAHLAALAALAFPDRVAGFVGMFGRYDLTSAASALRPAPGLAVPDVVRLASPPPGFEDLDPKGRLALLAGTPRDALTDDVLGRISPVTQAHAGAPAALLLHGTGDAIVSHAHSLRFAESLVAAGTREEVDVKLLPGANHEDPVFATSDVIREVTAFVHRCNAHTGARTRS